MLGIEVNYNCDRGLIHICQSQFIIRLNERFGPTASFPNRNPHVFGQSLSEINGSKKADSKQCRESNGSLLYIAGASSPDICV